MDSAIRKPRIAAFEVTRKCRMNCIHCRASAQAEVQNDLATAECKKIIKAVADYNRCVFIFTGGEPFEREDIFELVDYAHQCGLVVSIATCGYDFDREKAERLKKAGVLTLSFSLDSDDAKTHDDFRRTAGAFDKTLAAIGIAKEAGLKFQINTTVTKLNADKLPAIKKISEDLGAYCFNPFMLVPAGRGKELADISLTPKEYEKVLRTVADLKANSSIDVRFTCAPRFAAVFSEAYPVRDNKSGGFDLKSTGGMLKPAVSNGMYPQSKKRAFGCLAASDFVFISHTGDVQTCGFLKISAGNILQTGDFGVIWEKSDFLNKIRQKKFGGKCGDCDYVQICGGCRARAFALTGDYLASDPLCSYKRQVSTLVAAHIEEDKLSAVADAVNALPNVSHNYLRRHYYNLWFTLKSCDVDKVIADLSKKFETDFYSFPSVKRYKLDLSAIKKHNPPSNFNALFCCKGDEAAAKYLSNLPQVSHCYERKTLPHWTYNIYAMIHERSSERIEKDVKSFTKEFNIKQFQILPTIQSLKD